jgi:hypothetical protein
MSKALNVTSISKWGEQSLSHPIPSSISEEVAIVALLSGVVKAGHAIKSFEIVEVQ